MRTEIRLGPHVEIDYPDNDGQPIAENTLQFEWITTIKGGLDAMFRERPDVFVAGDLFWYPVEGKNTIRTAPDAMVVIGRPKGYRGSYQQWKEGGIAPQVVFEVLAPGNRPAEMAEKLQFYETHGVKEYYIYDPDRIGLEGWIRANDHLRKLTDTEGWVSPELGIRFEISGDDLRIIRPDGQRFLTYLEQDERGDREQQRADAARLRADAADQRAERLAEKLRGLGIDPDL